jgi:hypothetical protein
MTRLPPMEPFSTTPALYFVIGCWLAFAAIFLLRKRAASKEVRRDRRAGLPIAVQGVAFFITWTIRRHADCGGTTFWSQIWYTSAAERWSRNALVSQQRKRHDAKESAT